MPTRDTFPSGSMRIGVEVEAPATPGKYPAVLLVYGTDQLMGRFGTSIRKFARDLADSGLVALIPDYLERTGTPAGIGPVWAALGTSQDTWVETLADAANYADGRSDVERGKLGIVGFSLGGNLALRLAKRSTAHPKAGAVVDFFAPISEANGIGGNVGALPPVQIHHGPADEIVPPAQSAELMGLLHAAGKARDVDYFYYDDYPGEGHGFEGPRAIADSTGRAIAFLHKCLT